MKLRDVRQQLCCPERTRKRNTRTSKVCASIGDMGQWTLQKRDWGEFEPCPQQPSAFRLSCWGNCLTWLELVHVTKWKNKNPFWLYYWKYESRQKLRIGYSDMQLISQPLGRLRKEDHWSRGVQGQLKEHSKIPVLKTLIQRETSWGWETPKSKSFELYFTQKIKHRYYSAVL